MQQRCPDGEESVEGSERGTFQRIKMHAKVKNSSRSFVRVEMKGWKWQNERSSRQLFSVGAEAVNK